MKKMFHTILSQENSFELLILELYIEVFSERRILIHIPLACIKTLLVDKNFFSIHTNINL